MHKTGKGPGSWQAPLDELGALADDLGGALAGAGAGVNAEIVGVAGRAQGDDIAAFEVDALPVGPVDVRDAAEEGFEIRWVEPLNELCAGFARILANERG